MNYLKLDSCDVNNGDGVRVVLWLSGCSHKCEGCHNPESWDYNNGNLVTNEVVDQILDMLNNDYIDGITISGGDPLHPINRYEVEMLCEIIKNKLPSKTIWIWTGYTIDKIPERIIELSDYIVDGKYEKDLKPLKWRGSSNQNVYHKGVKVEL
ncbi:MAG: anaerobic ribonucleoside-triphosphate reductase activating protein [Cetobacterium sp.]|uniref:anaerobic ribonucleoside-triphosphate reductase activating protein n=1 Tax=Cetobacterium sp. TaxID=2071632 RepID=UPI003F2DBFEB